MRVSVDGLLLLSGRRTRGKLGKGDVAGQKFRRRERLRLQKEADIPTPYPVICKVWLYLWSFLGEAFRLSTALCSLMSLLQSHSWRLLQLAAAVQ